MTSQGCLLKGLACLTQALDRAHPEAGECDGCKGFLQEERIGEVVFNEQDLDGLPSQSFHKHSLMGWQLHHSKPEVFDGPNHLAELLKTDRLDNIAVGVEPVGFQNVFLGLGGR